MKLVVYFVSLLTSDGIAIDDVAFVVPLGESTLMRYNIDSRVGLLEKKTFLTIHLSEEVAYRPEADRRLPVSA
jgi:hypothetical protein